MDKLAFLNTLTMCMFHDSFCSVVTPRYLAESGCFKISVAMQGVFSVSLVTTFTRSTLHFSRLKVSCYLSSQSSSR